MDDNVRSLGAERADKAGDNRLWSIVEMLDDARRDYLAVPDDEKPGGALVLFLHTGDEIRPDFDINYCVCHMKASQILAALECLKVKILKEMCYL
jgi:hypothetical protein